MRNRGKLRAKDRRKNERRKKRKEVQQFGLPREK